MDQQALSDSQPPPPPGAGERDAVLTPGDAAAAGEDATSASRGLPHALQHLERRVVPYWLLSGLLTAVVLCGLLAALVLFLANRFPDQARWLWLTTGVLAALLLAWAVIAPPLAHTRWRYGITREMLLARHGILWHEERAIPVSRMQHVDLSRGPLERAFGLATLVVFTAGSDAASVRIPGLAPATANDLRDRILEARGADVL